MNKIDRSDFIAHIIIIVVKQTVDDVVDERVDERVAADAKHPPYSATVARKPREYGCAAYRRHACAAPFLDSLQIHLSEY